MDLSESAAIKPRKRWVRSIVIAVIAALVVTSGAAVFLGARYLGNIDRLSDVFAGLVDSDRPTGDDATTFLLAGSDSREIDTDTSTLRANGPANQRADTLMLLRISADGKSSQLISIPRDSWVEVPGYGHNKINAAYAFGGPALLIKTVEQVTNVRIDHFAVVDFQGFKNITDLVGGVTIVSAGEYGLTPGAHHMTGEEALAYVRERKHLPNGDFDRVRRQQVYLRAMLREVKAQHAYKDPAKLDRILRAATSSIAVDDNLSYSAMVKLAMTLGGLNESDMSFFLAPVAGYGWEGEQSVVYLDTIQCDIMFKLFREGELGVDSGFETLQPDPAV
ncbi:MAG: LCP family protein [Nocardiaceae bacterium]|nr:LCP family protein [Nocardiaceae bacterium]